MTNIYSTYIQPRLETIRGWARRGLTIKQIAEGLCVSETDFRVCMDAKKSLRDALIKGREDANIAVENALYTRAIGCTQTETTKSLVPERDEEGCLTGRKVLDVTKVVSKEVVPDVTAQQFWLSHRDPEEWTKERSVKGNCVDDGFIEALRGAVAEVWDDE